MEPLWTRVFSVDTLAVAVGLALVAQYLVYWPEIRSAREQVLPVLRGYLYVIVPGSLFGAGLACLLLEAVGAPDGSIVARLTACSYLSVWALPLTMALAGAIEIAAFPTGISEELGPPSRSPLPQGILRIHRRTVKRRLVCAFLLMAGTMMAAAGHRGLVALGVMTVAAAGVSARGLSNWLGRRSHLVRDRQVLSLRAVAAAVVVLGGLWIGTQYLYSWRWTLEVERLTALWGASLLSTAYSLITGALVVMTAGRGSFQEAFGLAPVAGAPSAQIVALMGRLRNDLDLCALGAVASLILATVAVLGMSYGIWVAERATERRQRTGRGVPASTGTRPVEPEAAREPGDTQGARRAFSPVVPATLATSALVALVAIWGPRLLPLGAEAPRLTLPYAHHWAATGLGLLALVAAWVYSRYEFVHATSAAERAWAREVGKALSAREGEATTEDLMADLATGTRAPSREEVEGALALLREWRWAGLQAATHYLLPRGKYIFS